MATPSGTIHLGDGIFLDLSCVVATAGSAVSPLREGGVAITSVLQTRGKMVTNLPGYHVKK